MGQPRVVEVEQVPTNNCGHRLWDDQYLSWLTLFEYENFGCPLMKRCRLTVSSYQKSVDIQMKRQIVATVLADRTFSRQPKNEKFNRQFK